MQFDFSKFSTKKIITRQKMVPSNDNRAPFGIYRSLVKPLSDRIIAFILLCSLSPLLLIVACLIKLESKGPVFFRQSRIGLHGKEFHIFKFRSMTVTENGSEVAQAKKNDARITKVGKFIRKTSIDELPQLLNVLFGDMALVGPRPHALSHDIEFTQRVPDYQKRHIVLPGITGLAQIKGFRGPTDTDESIKGRVKYDLQYAHNVTFWNDLKILFKTAFVVLNDKNAF